ncbi:MAG: restriction endonuclease subunit S [Alphaproteobacteria bacterium]
MDEIHLPLKDIKKYLVSDTSILITRSASPGATRLIENYEKNTIYCGFIICLDIFDLKMKYPLFFFLKNIEKIMTGQSSGTIMKNVSQETLKGLYLALPSNKSDPVISSFNGIISSAFLKMNRIQQENQQLTQLRDWLLPMLMNGQVKVA